MNCLQSHQQIKSNKSNTQKQLEDVKTFNNTGDNNSSYNKQLLDQPNQAISVLIWSTKKDFYFYQGIF